MKPNLVYFCENGPAMFTKLASPKTGEKQAFGLLKLSATGSKDPLFAC